MSIPQIRKFKISLKPESAKGQPDGKGGKTQGLRTGDIVRRQYFDGRNVIYSLMCVIDYGVDKVNVEEAIMKDDSYELVSQNPIEYKTHTVEKQQPWFSGILLDGDAPMPGEVLDFVRITNLFDQSRSGALYLTASDAESPFMDVIDGIGRNCSLTWPENINNTELEDPQSQYIVKGTKFEVEYIASQNDRRRICRIKKLTGGNVSVKQTFTQYVQNPNQVLVSFWTKATSARTIKMSMVYVDDSRTDGEVDVNVGTDWEYHLYPITVDNSGRHRRTVSFDLSAIQANEEIYIADFNAILLSSVANFGDSSQIRVGKLTGISDPVFGKLDSYGGYFQKLFASTSAHISGTLTAGDENGFAATFYAGKIHKNAFLNSLEPECDIQPLDAQNLMNVHGTVNPTGIGQVFEVTSSITLKGQLHSWLYQTDNVRVDKDYTFSFWAYCGCGGQLAVSQNSKVIGTVQIPHSDTLGWHRQKLTFKFQDIADNEDVVFKISASFTSLTGNIADSAEKQLFLFTAPQLESGRNVTQYQPTDEVVNHLCEDYGAWFNRGGIGGTIQNPLIRLNYDGKGGIATRQSSPTDKPSLALNQDGSGHVAKGNISWDAQGNTTLNKNVHLTWDNLDEDIKETIVSNSIKIVGGDMFTILSDTDADNPSVDPLQIVLTVESYGAADSTTTYKWQYLDGSAWTDFPSGNTANTFTILPTGSYWQGNAKLEVKCVATIGGKEYSDSIVIRKQVLTGYTLEVVSANGVGFKNDTCDTVLKANVYYQGKLVDPDFAKTHFHFRWKKLDFQNGAFVEDADFWGTPGADGYIDPTQMSVTVNYPISGLDKFICEMTNDTPAGFPYDLPIYFFE